MSPRRTIRLREYQPTRERLSRSELDQLLALPAGLLDIRPLREAGLYELRPGSTVGAVVLPSVHLLIQPKIPLDNLFFMLGYGAGLTEWRPERFPFAEDPDLLRAMGWVYDAELRRALRSGVARSYETRAETLFTLRGRIDIGEQVRRRQHQPFPLECRFDEYTADTELNRVLRAALVRLLRIPGLDGNLARSLRYRLHSFEEVSAAEYTEGTVPELTFNRLNDHWEAAARLAQLILRRQSVRDAEGRVLGSGFTVDMNKLFERFVEAVVREVAVRAGWRLESQQERKLSARVTMQPDLLLSRAGCDHAVADVKYKVPEAGWTHPDLYQMLAYCTALGLPSGMLIYAGDAPAQTHVVERSGIRLEVAGLQLNGPREEILGRTKAMARRLVRSARRHRSGRSAPVGHLSPEALASLTTV